MANIAGIMELYTAYFNRAADKNGVDYWANEMDNNGWTLDDVANTFAQQPEYTALYDGKTNQEIVDLVYTNVLNRDADAAGAEYWLAELDSGAVTVSQFILAVVNSATEMVDGVYKHPTDAAIVNNKTAVSQYAYDTNSNATDISLAGVTEDEASTQSAKNQIDAENPANIGETFTLTTGVDVLIGTAKNDTFTGTTTTYANADRVVDSSSTDNDTYTVSISANATPDVIGVENVNVTTESTAALTVNAGSMSGVKTLTVTPGNVTVAGSTIQGSKTVSIDKLSSAKVEKVVIGDGATGAVTVDMTQTTATDSKAGVAIDALTATGNITITGATTLNADNAADATGEKIIVQAITGANAAENAKAVTVNAAKALDVEINDNGASKFTGAITVNAAAAKEVQVQSASGGVTINAAKAADSAGNGIVVAGIDDSGAVITTGSYGTKTAGVITKQGLVSVTGGTGSADTATISAAGYVKVTSNAIETLNLTANAANVEYEIAGTAATTYNLSGANDVVLTGNESSFDGKTVTDTTTAGTTAVKITTLDDSDLSKVATDKIIVAHNAASKTLTVANNANIELATDIATAFSSW